MPCSHMIALLKNHVVDEPHPEGELLLLLIAEESLP